MASKTKPYRGTQSVMRAFKILQTFSDQQPEWRLTELAEEVDLNRTTTYRLLTALESLDMVTRDEDTQAYRLGSEAIVLGGRALRANYVRQISHKELEQLSAETGETATLDVLEGADTLVVDEVKGRFVLGTMPGAAPAIGTRWPANSSSTGKVLLAWLPPREVAERLPQPLPQLTPHTITSREQLQQELAQVRQRGYALAQDELEIGYSDIAAPLFNHEGDVVAALTVGGATTRLTAEKRQQAIRLLRDAALRVSAQLGHRA